MNGELAAALGMNLEDVPAGGAQGAAINAQEIARQEDERRMP